MADSNVELAGLPALGSSRQSRSSRLRKLHSVATRTLHSGRRSKRSTKSSRRTTYCCVHVGTRVTLAKVAQRMGWHRRRSRASPGATITCLRLTAPIRPG
jgi:hypothetical protein